MQKQTKKVNFSREKPFNDLERMHKSFCEERELNTEFYKLFHETRLMLIKEFQDKGANKHKAVYYAQILLKRLLIIFFAEDLSKLKIKFRNMILESLENSSISNESTIIADTIKNLFLHLARDYQDSIINIDGLFEEKIPKSIYFKDLREFYDFNVSNLRSKLRKERKSDGYIEIILSKYSHLNPIIINLLNIAFYDFNSEIKINILGYIFEKSISDLEEIFDDKIHRRKKKGVFYTPQYITDYICRNTIIQYLSNEGANTITDLIYEYCENIDELQKKIEKIRILDPACGSGVFLIKTVEIFLEILREIEKVKQSKSIKIVKISKREKPQKVVLEETISYGKAVRKILENNIFGLDINKESIQVTKLSLGLKIIKENRSGDNLGRIDLTHNIRCGDSLIEDPGVAKAKAFKWREEFKEVFENGGFDIILGNPPFVNLITNVRDRKYYEKRYPEVYTGKNDLYYFFFRKAIELCKNRGYIAFIAPRYLMEAHEAQKIRKYIRENTRLLKIIDFSNFKVFPEANIDTAIYILKKTRKKSKVTTYRLLNDPDSEQVSGSFHFKEISLDQELLPDTKWYFIDEKSITLLKKIQDKSTHVLSEVAIISKGVQTGKDPVFVIDKPTIETYSIESDILRKWIKNSQISPYGLIETNLYIILSNRYTIQDLSKFPNLKNYLEQNRDKLLKRARVDQWFHWRKGDERPTIDWKAKKIITPYKSAFSNFTIDFDQCYFSQDVVLIMPKNNQFDLYFLLAFLNSKLCELYFKIKGKKLGELYEYYPKQLSQLSIKHISLKEQKIFREQVQKMLSYNKELHKLKNEIIHLIQEQSNFKKKLKKFPNANLLAANEILKVTERITKTSLSKEQKIQVEKSITPKISQIKSLKLEKEKTEEKINQMIYRLFDLTEEEVKLIENFGRKEGA